jgi:hypothetical protein
VCRPPAVHHRSRHTPCAVRPPCTTVAGTLRVPSAPRSPSADYGTRPAPTTAHDPQAAWTCSERPPWRSAYQRAVRSTSTEYRPTVSTEYHRTGCAAMVHVAARNDTEAVPYRITGFGRKRPSGSTVSVVKIRQRAQPQSYHRTADVAARGGAWPPLTGPQAAIEAPTRGAPGSPSYGSFVERRAHAAPQTRGQPARTARKKTASVATYLRTLLVSPGGGSYA